MATEAENFVKTLIYLTIISSILLWRISESYILQERRRNCPTMRYYEEGRCRHCYHFCGRAGCTGPGSYVGEGGCNSCIRGKELPHDPSTIQCISNFTPCRTGSYLRRVPVTDPGPLAGFTLCKLCHPLCSTCSGPGAPFCLTCKYYKLDGRCVRRCPRGSQTDHHRKTCNFYSGRHRRRHTSSYRRRSDVVDM